MRKNIKCRYRVWLLNKRDVFNTRIDLLLNGENPADALVRYYKERYRCYSGIIDVGLCFFAEYDHQICEEEVRCQVKISLHPSEVMRTDCWCLAKTSVVGEVQEWVPGKEVWFKAGRVL